MTQTFRVWTLIQDNGDGSNSTLFFASKEEAEDFMEAADACGFYDNYWGDGVSYHDFTFKDGVLTNGTGTYAEEYQCNCDTCKRED